VSDEQKEMRAVYAETLIALAEKDERIVVLEADLMGAHGTRCFAERFPERTFNVGVAEADMVGIAAGLASTGLIPFAASFGTFASRKACDAFYINAVYSRLGVKLVGSDPGISAAHNGGTHMPLEDVGIYRSFPDLVIFEPADPISLAALLIESAACAGSTYMRLHRKEAPRLYEPEESFTLGKGKLLREGGQVALIATGVIMVNEALQAAEILAGEGISAAVIDMHTVKPIDRELVLQQACGCGALVTCENHQEKGGLGSAVAEVIAEEGVGLLARVGVKERFGEAGTVEYLKQNFKLTAEDICMAARRVLAQKEDRARRAG
jgi:transketolase